jgi:hypothetical protein
MEKDGHALSIWRFRRFLDRRVSQSKLQRPALSAFNDLAGRHL